MARLSTAALALALLTPALADALSQPDGTQIPVQKPGNNLWDLFNTLGEPIVPDQDAADVPETYTPSCQLQFTMVSRGGAGFKNVFGWYNVVDGGPPDNSDLHVLLDCQANPPDSVPLAIASSGEFGGGQIGFFLITPEGQSSVCASLSNVGRIYYSQKAYNPDNGLQSGGQSYIHLLTYDSKNQAASFYFAWEDLFNGGDNEFTDFVARVDGITCTGSGDPCDTGKQGICSLGTKQCVNGALQCVQQFQPSAERCDGIDTDCDGVADNGATCTSGQVCREGRCQAPCGSGELGAPCPTGQQCVSGSCVDPACQSVSCPTGQACQGGHCVDPCAGVVCPHGQRCGIGRCIDPCTVVTCGQGEVCTGGACRPGCDCVGCPQGQTCRSDGTCAEPACATKTCSAGTYCVAGSCVDACQGAVCPTGQACQDGQCRDTVPDAGATTASTSGSGGASGSSGSSGSAGSGASSGSSGKTSSGSSGSTGTTAGKRSTTASGCGCDASSGGAALLALLLIAARRRPEA